MIERVLENWLDNVNERGYETAFCQTLIALGHTIIRRPAHGPTEHGKDIVSRDRERRIHAYQLKTGDLTKASWRQIRDEVVELVEVPIQEPGISAASKFTPHLVTNGQVSEPVKDEVRARNETWRRKYRSLDVISKDSLFSLFIKLHGNFLPATPKEFERFLRLYLAEKRGFLRKDKFSEFLSSLLPPPRKVKSSQIRRDFASTAVLANYILSGYQSAENHLAVAEGWMLVIAQLLRIAEVKEAPEARWRPSIEICIEAWETAVAGLVQEAMKSPNWIEWDTAVDGFVFPHRKTILLGYLACYALYKRITTGALPNEDDILVKVDSELKPLTFWGETASPFVLAIAFFLWKRGSEGEAVELIAAIIKLISYTNGVKRGLGLPDPYQESPTVLQQQLEQQRVSDILQLVLQADRSQGKELSQNYYQTLGTVIHNAVGNPIYASRQTFAGRSFSIRSLVEFVARRGRKRLLRHLWYDITRVDYTEFVPDKTADSYLWRAKKGNLVTRRFKRPQTWTELVSSANAKVERTNLPFASFPQLLLPFALVYPHRLTPALVRSWERLLK